jgi:hypothetical protein
MELCGSGGAVQRRREWHGEKAGWSRSLITKRGSQVVFKIPEPAQAREPFSRQVGAGRGGLRQSGVGRGPVSAKF